MLKLNINTLNKLKQIAQSKPTEQTQVKINIPVTSLKERLQLARQKVAVQEQEKESVSTEIIRTQPIKGHIEHNKEQQDFINMAVSGADCVLIGAAGTGKTTSLKGAVNSILNNRAIPMLTDHKHRYLTLGSPGIVLCSYTRRSVANIKKAIPELAHNCITIHKLLQFEPMFYEITDAEGNTRQTMRFVPGRDKLNPLDSAIKIIVIDESGTVPLELYELLIAALPDTSQVQFIYLGDLEQNPPVFGAAVLGFKGLEHRDTTIQLTQVYRQALESPIIRLAHRILSGQGIPEKEYPDWKTPGQLEIRAWKKKISATEAMLTMSYFFSKAFENRLYDPEKDCILMTQNVNFGTNELNKHVANMYARAQGRETYEIISGFLKHYFSPGDTVMYEKEDAEIVRIEPNPKYQGKTPQPHSKSLDYFGHNSTPAEIQHLDLEEHFDAMMESAVYDDIEDRKEVASHKIFVRFKNVEGQIDQETGEEKLIMLDTAAEINNLALGYAMTVHKAQGSEWRKVFIVIHHSNAAMLSREILYTAVTRAREDLTILCESESLIRGVEIQKIKGNTLEDKLNHFARKLSEKSILLK